MNLINDSLAMPLLGMFTLTMLVWLYMFIMSYITAHVSATVNPQLFAAE